MKQLPASISDEELFSFIDQWVLLLEREDYDAAFAWTDHVPHMGWTADLLRLVIKAYGEASPDQRVTLEGVPTDISQHKAIDWWTGERQRELGNIWYDLNIDGEASDLTALFELERRDGIVVVALDEITVM